MEKESSKNVKGIFIFKNEKSAKKLVNNFTMKGSFNALDEISSKIIESSLDFIKNYEYISYPPSIKEYMKKSGLDYRYELGRSVAKNSSKLLIKNLFKGSLKLLSSIDIDERKENSEKIKLNPRIDIRKYKNKKILIVDFDYISGATINRCLEILEKEKICADFLTFTKELILCN